MELSWSPESYAIPKFSVVDRDLILVDPIHRIQARPDGELVGHPIGDGGQQGDSEQRSLTLSRMGYWAWLTPAPRKNEPVTTNGQTCLFMGLSSMNGEVARPSSGLEARPRWRA